MVETLADFPTEARALGAPLNGGHVEQQPAASSEKAETKKRLADMALKALLDSPNLDPFQINEQYSRWRQL